MIPTPAEHEDEDARQHAVTCSSPQLCSIFEFGLKYKSNRALNGSPNWDNFSLGREAKDARLASSEAHDAPWRPIYLHCVASPALL